MIWRGRSWHALAGFVTGFVLATAPVLAQTVEIGGLQAGLLCRPGGEVRVPAPNTNTGWTYDGGVGPMAFVSTSRRIPAVIGLSMGVSAHTTGDRLDPVDIIITHPPLAGSGMTRESWQTDFKPGLNRIVYYEFDSEDTLVQGFWTFEAYYGDRRLYAVAFRVVAPDAVPDLVDACVR